MPRITRSTPAPNAFFEIGQPAEPAAELDRDIDRGTDLRNGLAIDRSPCDGAVEIDDVQPLRAGLHPTACGQEGSLS